MAPIQVLLVDDNQGYREAFRRNLTVRGYAVSEAADGAEALSLVHSSAPDVVVTDLAMGHPTEGLDLIRQARALRPHLPVIMISAVGTFDEGAEAMRLGACQVISKSRIDKEIESLYQAIESASVRHRLAREYQIKIEALRARAIEDRGGAATSLNELLREADVPDSIKGEIFDLLLNLTGEEAANGADGPSGAEPPAGRAFVAEAEAVLSREVEGLEAFEEDTRKNLISAEVLYQQSLSPEAQVDFSRSMGFLYCFAVENQVKAALRKRMQKFFGHPETLKLVRGLLEDNRKSLSIFYQQFLLRSQRETPNEATIENFFFTLLRMIEHRGRYRPDGLKALGIVLLCFGRTYRFRKFNQDVVIENPLGIRGLASDEDVARFAALLINLQHYRNPYIHPEISQLTKISKIRETTFACLNYASTIQ